MYDAGTPGHEGEGPEFIWQGEQRRTPSKLGRPPVLINRQASSAGHDRRHDDIAGGRRKAGVVPFKHPSISRIAWAVPGDGREGAAGREQSCR